MRWTEHGPVPVEDDEAVVNEVAAPAPTSALEDPAPGEDVESVRRRLAERGLLRQEPSVRIRDVTEPALRPVPEVSFAPEERAGTAEVADDPADVAGLEAERAGPGSAVRCPKCRTTQHVADDASGFVCESCSAVWRWAACAGCDVVSLTFARQESWRCTSCGASTRSWWRTATAPRDGQQLRDRRRDEAATRRRAAAYEKARRRRWKVLAAGVAVIVAASVAATIVTKRSSADAARGSGARTCDAYVSSNFTTSADPAEVRRDLDELAAIADTAPDDIRLPAQRLAAAGRPGDPTFEDARRVLTSVCRAGADD